jgi:hypothetical protein
MMRALRWLSIVWLVAACTPGPGVVATVAPATATALPPAEPPATATVEATMTPEPTPRPTEDRVESWRADVERLASEMRDWHPNLFGRVSEAEFEAAVASLDAVIPELTDEQIIVEMSRLLSSIGDGHSFIPLFQENVDFRLYPLRLYQFSDGLYVVAADAPHEDLAGARVVQIGGLSAEEAYAAVAPVLPHDNEMTVKLLAPVYLIVPEVLQALGIIDDAAAPGYVLEKPDGTQTTVNFEPISSEPYRDWLSTHLVLAGLPGGGEPLYLSRKNEAFFWYTLLDGTNTLYIQYNLVWGTAQWDSGQTIEEFSAEVDAFASEHQVERTIVDVRHNLGGNNSVPLENVLRENAYINQPGRLFVLTGRQTFSGAIKFLVNVEKDTAAVFVGEPTAGPPNFYAEQNTSVLSNSGIQALISMNYWENSTPDDTRDWIEPDIPAALSSADYFGGRDPVLAAALAAGDEP